MATNPQVAAGNVSFDAAIGQLEKALEPVLAIRKENDRTARRQRAAAKEAADKQAEAEAAAAVSPSRPTVLATLDGSMSWCCVWVRKRH